MASRWQQFLASVGRGQQAPDPATGQTAQDPNPSPETAGGAPQAAGGDGVAVAEDPSVAVLRAALAQEQMRRIQAEAEGFAAEVIADGRATPAERAAIVATMTQASLDDENVGPIVLADGRPANRADLVMSQYVHRATSVVLQELAPVHGRDGKATLQTVAQANKSGIRGMQTVKVGPGVQLPTPGGVTPGQPVTILNNHMITSYDGEDDDETPLDPQMREKMLSATAEGRSILADEKQNGNRN